MKIAIFSVIQYKACLHTHEGAQRHQGSGGAPIPTVPGPTSGLSQNSWPHGLRVAPAPWSNGRSSLAHLAGGMQGKSILGLHKAYYGMFRGETEGGEKED